jgi:biotin carboxyl carrier protein
MPGRVTSILVSQGDSVEVDTPLIVIEAMKMQNEIVSPLAGKVRSVLVQEGSTIRKDSLLIEIEGD